LRLKKKGNEITSRFVFKITRGFGRNLAGVLKIDLMSWWFFLLEGVSEINRR